MANPAPPRSQRFLINDGQPVLPQFIETAVYNPTVRKYLQLQVVSSAIAQK